MAMLHVPVVSLPAEIPKNINLVIHFAPVALVLHHLSVCLVSRAFLGLEVQSARVLQVVLKVSYLIFTFYSDHNHFFVN